MRSAPLPPRTPAPSGHVSIHSVEAGSTCQALFADERLVPGRGEAGTRCGQNSEEGPPDVVGVPGAAATSKGRGNKKPNIRELVIECLCPRKGVDTCGDAACVCSLLEMSRKKGSCSLLQFVYEVLPRVPVATVICGRFEVLDWSSLTVKGTKTGRMERFEASHGRDDTALRKYMFSMTPSFSSSEKASLTDMSLSELKVLLNAQWKKNLGATMARKNKVNKCVSKLVAHDKHRSDIRHQMRVTWMVRLTTTSGICEEVYFRADVALEADFEARVDWVLVRQHYELLVLAQGRGVDVLVFVRDGTLMVDALQAACDSAAGLEREATLEEVVQLGEMARGSAMSVPLSPDVIVTPDQVLEINELRAERELRIMRDYAGWEQTLRVVKCTVCLVLCVDDSRFGVCKSMGKKLTEQRCGGGARCGRCMQAEAQSQQGQSTGKWGAANNMIPCAVPVELACLSHVEKLLVCRYCPMMRITTLSKGMHVLNDNSIAFHQPLSKLVNVLPRALNDTGLLFVIRGLQSDLEKQRVSAETKIYRVRREHIRGAILWLINNYPPYMQHVSVI